MTHRHQLVDATGTRRRLEALAVQGHTGRSIGVALGRPAASSKALIHAWRNRRHIGVDIAADVARLYDQIADQRGPSHRTRMRALIAGFQPPEAWHGINIDDPEAEPYSGGEAA